VLATNASKQGTEAGGRNTRQPRRPSSNSSIVAPDSASAGDVGRITIELRHIDKGFGGVEVLRDVSLSLGAGEVLGLLGDNGAGKSTLIKIVTGVHRPDAGQLFFNGKEVRGLTVERARALGIETVFQERALADQLSLWNNIFMGRPLTRWLGFMNVRAMRKITSELMGESMGFTSAVLTPDTWVTGLSGGERQGLAIVRALHFEADIIILDEPTMGLSLKEVDKLVQFVRSIKAAGKSAIFIDHNIFHVYSVADRVVVLDRGRVAAELSTSQYSLDQVTDIMREIATSGTFVDPRGRKSGNASKTTKKTGRAS
jgi:simple sugar transport system ATP-binding protein